MRNTIKIITAIISLAVIFVIYWAIQYLAVFSKNEIIVPPEASPAAGYTIEEFASNLSVPWSIVFTSADRILISERNGVIRVIENGILQNKPLASFNVSMRSEEGLMGMAIASNYSETKDVYACLAYQNDSGKLQDKVIRFNGESGSILAIVIDNLPAAQYHAGCRLLIHDNHLFITVGDATNKNIAQDRTSFGGKILRLSLDGSIPSDNPFPDSPIWTFGHRNPQGLAWDGLHDVLWSSEHGPSVFDGPAGGDEINIIEKGKNYGWPIVSHDKTKDGLEQSIIQFTPAVAPASLLYYSSDVLPFFKGNLFFGGLVGEGLYRLILKDDIQQKPQVEKMAEVKFGRIRDVVQGPDGFIYFTTSNRDSRGKPSANDDKIYRIIPKY